MDALDFLDKHQVKYETRNVLTDDQAMQRLREISGKTKTPTMEFGEFTCADFSVDELLAALEDAPSVRQQLGLENA